MFSHHLPVSHFASEIQGSSRALLLCFFPRKTGGWIRVEVVPGRTPFLLSNSVLKALRAVIDTENRSMWFKGHNQSIPLCTCRKNLMSVDFSQILNLENHGHEGSRMHEIHVANMDERKGSMLRVNVADIRDPKTPKLRNQILWITQETQ